MSCLFCNHPESSCIPSPQVDYICGLCVVLLADADQADLKRAYQKALNKGYLRKVSALESFIIPDGKYEQQKGAAEEKVQAAKEMLDDSVARFEKIKQKIIEDGEKKKQQIIEDARQESQMLLEGTQRKIQNQIAEAKNLIRSELIESAIALAEKKLPQEITADDEQKLIEHYMEITAGK